MRLSRLSVSHYKSLEQVEITDMPPITVLVGCNGAGKSNIVDVLRFLRDALKEGLDHAVSSRGGIDLIRQYSPTKPYQITLDLGFSDDSGASFRYQLSLTSLRDANFRVEREYGEWTLGCVEDFLSVDREGGLFDRKPRPLSFTRNVDGEISVFIADKAPRFAKRARLAADNLAFGQSLTIENSQLPLQLGGKDLIRFIQDIRFSSIYPNTLRQPAHPDTDPVLKENGANWSSILRALRKTQRGKQALEQIKEMMQVVMPQLEDISTQALGGYIHPRFKIREQNGKLHYFDPSQISDGTLRILGILLGLYHTPHPSLMVIEEPEQTVNPALLAVLVDAFAESSERTQLFITSHSPYLVDLFPTENIRVVTMNEGATRVAPIRASQQAAIKEHLLSLEQIMSAEGLLPEDA